MYVQGTLLQFDRQRNHGLYSAGDADQSAWKKSDDIMTINRENGTWVFTLFQLKYKSSTCFHSLTDQ